MLAPPAIALSGMKAAQTRLQSSAQNIANLGTASFRRQQVSQTAEIGGGVSTALSQAPEAGNALEADVVGLLQARNSFLANLAVFRTGDKMMGLLLDALG
jgi:flagellar hook-associated protein FlgK